MINEFLEFSVFCGPTWRGKESKRVECDFPLPLLCTHFHYIILNFALFLFFPYFLLHPLLCIIFLFSSFCLFSYLHLLPESPLSPPPFLHREAFSLSLFFLNTIQFTELPDNTANYEQTPKYLNLKQI